METQITYYKERNLAGKFKSLKIKRLAYKTIKYQLIILSILLNIVLARKLYNIRCNVNGQVVGYFTTKQSCDNLATNWFNSTQTPQISTNLINNPDLYVK